MYKIIETQNAELSKINKLEIKDNKINEILKYIETQNVELTKYNNIYNEIMLENNKLKEEINNLKNNEIKNNKSINQKDNNINYENNIPKTQEQPQSQYNNLITYNINKNNNYNIINSEINNFNNYIQNNNINDNNNNNNVQEPKIENSRQSLKDKDVNKEAETEKKERTERKASRAFERYRRMSRKGIPNKEGEVRKSNKISDMVKLLESKLSGADDIALKERNNSADIVRIENENELNNNVVNLIDNQPVINKKKKKHSSFSYDDN